jgi:hypothetical protein
MKKFSLVVGCAVVALAAVTANAAITGVYVDADALNTAPPADLLGTGTSPAAETDDLWQIRPGFGDSNTILEAYSDTETVPSITTSVGLPNSLGIYNIRVVYWTNTNAFLGDPNALPFPIPSQPWGITAALSGDSLQTLYDPNGTATGTTDQGGVLVQREFLLGQVSGVSSFAVEIGGTTDNGIVRQWYDGVSYEQVGLVPEPNSAVLLLMGMAGLWHASRRRRS